MAEIRRSQLFALARLPSLPLITPSEGSTHTTMPQNQLSSTGINTMDTSNPETKGNRQPETVAVGTPPLFEDQSLTEAFTLGLPSEVSNKSIRQAPTSHPLDVSVSNPSATTMQQTQQHLQGHNGISFPYDTTAMEHHRGRTIREGINNGFNNFLDYYAPLPWKPVHGETATATSMDGILKALEAFSDDGAHRRIH